MVRPFGKGAADVAAQMSTLGGDFALKVSKVARRALGKTGAVALSGARAASSVMASGCAKAALLVKGISKPSSEDPGEAL